VLLGFKEQFLNLPKTGCTELVVHMHVSRYAVARQRTD